MKWIAFSFRQHHLQHLLHHMHCFCRLFLVFSNNHQNHLVIPRDRQSHYCWKLYFKSSAVVRIPASPNTANARTTIATTMGMTFDDPDPSLSLCTRVGT